MTESARVVSLDSYAEAVRRAEEAHAEEVERAHAQYAASTRHAKLRWLRERGTILEPRARCQCEEVHEAARAALLERIARSEAARVAAITAAAEGGP